MAVRSLTCGLFILITLLMRWVGNVIVRVLSREGTLGQRVGKMGMDWAMSSNCAEEHCMILIRYSKFQIVNPISGGNIEQIP